MVWWNAAAGRITGVPEAEALGRPLPFPVTEHGVEVEHRLPDGRWLEAVCSPLAEMDPPETVVTFRDVTTAKMVEDAKSLFLATAGHELRTPLTVIRGFAGTLIGRWDALTDAERREAVGVIAARADGLGLLVEQVLASSYAEAGERRLERRPLAVGPLLTAAAVDVGSLSSRHDVTVVVPEDLPEVLADEQALRTVLGLLVDNAVKYSPDGGLVALSAAASDDGESVCIRVDDEGIGVAERGPGAGLRPLLPGQRRRLPTERRLRSGPLHRASAGAGARGIRDADPAPRRAYRAAGSSSVCP